MLYVFISFFIGIWAVFAFPSHTAFQYVPLMQMIWQLREIRFARFARIEALYCICL